MAEPFSEIVEKAFAEQFDAPVAFLRRSLVERLGQEAASAQAVAADEAGRAARLAAAEALSVAIRRLRQASSITEIGATLLECAGAWAGRVGLFVHRGDVLNGWRAAGFDRANPDADGFSGAWAAFQVGLKDAPALAQVVETREAVVSLAVADHLSAPLIELLKLAPEDKVYLFPLCLRQSVVGVVYADAVGAPEIQPAAIESLCAVAELTLEVVSTRPQPRDRAVEPETGRLELPAVRPPARPVPTDWDVMSPEDREVHMRAQRFARVLVADLQLYRSVEIREGKKNRNLYAALKDEIDKSREVYQRKFGNTAAAGVDYFHTELLHTVAENQESLLGPDYPGPMVAYAVG